MRQCGECTLCCKLVPVGEMEKPAGVRCQHVRWGKGCMIYAHRPDSCRLWACAWRSETDSAGLRRPDRSHCVIDPIGMNITKRDNDTGESEQAPAIQVWCDPDHPQAYLAPSILEFVRRRAANGLSAIIRYNNDDALLLVAPELTGKSWLRFHSGKTPLGRLADCTDVANMIMPARATAPYYQGVAHEA